MEKKAKQNKTVYLEKLKKSWGNFNLIILPRKPTERLISNEIRGWKLNCSVFRCYTINLEASSGYELNCTTTTLYASQCCER